jgi:hypothetical protein
MQIMTEFYEAAHDTGNAPEALAEVQRIWLVKLRTGRRGRDTCETRVLRRWRRLKQFGDIPNPCSIP